MSDEERLARKRVDEDWKERVEREQSQPVPPAGETGKTGVVGGPAAAPVPAPVDETEAGHTHEEMPAEARFDIFLSGLSMEALIGLGDLPHPVTKKRETNLPQAKYLIDLLGILDEKTRGNLTLDEAHLLSDMLYQLRMRYMSKTQA